MTPCTWSDSWGSLQWALALKLTLSNSVYIAHYLLLFLEEGKGSLYLLITLFAFKTEHDTAITAHPLLQLSIACSNHIQKWSQQLHPVLLLNSLEKESLPSSLPHSSHAAIGL